MPQEDLRYRSQDVDYLGFLEAQLRDLKGIDTLAYELIQNADDVKDDDGRSRTSWLSFDVTDEALIVENDGLFRRIDFERLQRVAGGSKRDESGTTGAFGIGFVAVYQITDAPEVFSSGIHWTIRPDAEPSKRIQERTVETTGTRFRLPWAYDPASSIRRILRADAIAPGQPSEFVPEIGDAIELAILFLKQLKVLILKRDGVIVRRYERTMTEDGVVRIEDQHGESVHWILLEDAFENEAIELRRRFPWQIEAKRSDVVQIAIPRDILLGRGRLYASLPSAGSTPLPFHLNADFYPTTDRKRFDFGTGFQADWNAAAMDRAGLCLAERLASLREALTPTGLWHLFWQSEESHQMAERGDLPAPFGSFWSAMLPNLSQEKLLLTSTEEWRLPGEVRLPPPTLPNLNSGLLEDLGIPLPHADLIPYSQLMARTEFGAKPLSLSDVATALHRLGLVNSTPLFNAPRFLREPGSWFQLWNIMGHLLDRLGTIEDRNAGLAKLSTIAFILSENMTLERPGHLYRGSDETRNLFPETIWLYDQIPQDRFPGRLVKEFTARQATTFLSEMPLDQMEHAWRLGRLDLPRLFHWFESHQIEILADDPSLKAAICRLPLCPLQGELRPLRDLYISGGFNDPLKLTGLVDMESIGGRRQFLRDLGVQELDFDTYVRVQIPRVFAQLPDLPSDSRHQLIQLLAERLGEIRDDEELRDTLSTLPLVACMDGSFRPAAGLFSTRDVSSLLGDQVHIAEPVASGSVGALHRWMGVRDQPAPSDLIEALRRISKKWQEGDKPVDEHLAQRVSRCWAELTLRLNEGEVSTETLASLRAEKLIINRQGRLRAPAHLFFPDDQEMANRFDDIDGYLLPSQPASAPAMAAAGVLPLSNAVQVELAHPVSSRPADEVQRRIAERRDLIERVFLAEGTAQPGAGQLDFMADLRVAKTEALRIQYQLPVGQMLIRAESQAVSAVLIEEEMLLLVAFEAGQAPWAAISRELAARMRDGRPTAGLALGIREVLSANTTAGATQVLDEMGYPRQSST